MKQSQKVATRFPIESDLEADNIKRLSDLIDEVYDDAESSMWKRKDTRVIDGMSRKRIGLVLASEETYPGASLGIVHQIQEFSCYTHSEFVGVVHGVGTVTDRHISSWLSLLIQPGQKIIRY